MTSRLTITRTAFFGALGGTAAAALLIGFAAGYFPAAARGADAVSTAEAKTKSVEDAYSAAVEDYEDQISSIQETSDSRRSHSDEQAAYIEELEQQIPSYRAAAAIKSKLTGYPTTTKVEGDTVRIYTSITDPRGEDGSPEAQQAIEICEAAATIMQEAGVGDVPIAVMESDDSTFVTGAPCVEH